MSETSCWIRLKTAVMMAWLAITAERTANSHTNHQYPPETGPGIDWKKQFWRTVSVSLIRRAPWPKYANTIEGYTTPMKPSRIEPLENWPRFANMASTPVMARITPWRRSKSLRLTNSMTALDGSTALKMPGCCATLWMPFTRRSTFQSTITGEKSRPIFLVPKGWTAKRRTRMAIEMPTILFSSAREGTATAMPPAAETMLTAGVKRPSDMVKQVPNRTQEKRPVLNHWRSKKLCEVASRPSPWVV